MFDLLPGWVPAFGQWCLLVVTGVIGLSIIVAVVAMICTFWHALWEDFTEWRRRRRKNGTAGH